MGLIQAHVWVKNPDNVLYVHFYLSSTCTPPIFPLYLTVLSKSGAGAVCDHTMGESVNERQIGSFGATQAAHILPLEDQKTW